MLKDIISRAYQLINEPLDPVLKTGDLSEVINYRESEAGETVEYFASNQIREAATLIAAAGDGSLTYHKIPLKTTVALTFSGLQSNAENILIDEILNSKDQNALAQKKEAIIAAMDSEEAYLVCSLVSAATAQEVNKVTGMDLLGTIVKMKEKVSDYATDYVLLVASDVMNKVDSYDLDMKASYNYRMGIKETLASIGVVKVIKIQGLNKVGAPVLANGTALLIGRNSKISDGRPITLLRRKFSKEIAEFSGAAEGAVRLVDIAKTPMTVVGGKLSLSYSCFGYESIISCLVNPYAVAFSDDILS